jgi:nucleoside-diphosphate kinase
MQIPEKLASKHYGVHKGKPFYEGVVKYLASSPSLVMVWEAQGVIAMARKMMGATFGYEAEAGTIRGDFGCSRGYNLIHGSDSPESAEFEIGLYFAPGEIVEYEFADSAWLYGKND